MFLTDPNRAHPVTRAVRAGVSLLLCLQFSSVFTLTLEARSFVGGATPVSGGSSGGADASAAGASTANAALAQQLQSQRQSLTRSVQVLHAMQQAQAAARAAAQQVQTGVPNGLGAGGLQVAAGVPLDPSLWQGAASPVQTSGENGRLVVKIDQTTQKAILTWDSFNVGRETDLVYDQQGNSDWVALNRVTDAQASPSQILGSIKADGSVYVLNANGVIFGGASQVNVRNLVAASASITDTQFLEHGIYSPGTTGSGQNTKYISSFTEAARASGATGAITVEAGAQITTNEPASVVEGGGYVMLLGTEVTNEGTLSTPRGQTLLAAGTDFAIRPGQGTDTNQGSSTRGHELAVNANGGEVRNAGLIQAAEGDITLVGKHVVQDGVALATTTVNQRGTIHLLTDLTDSASTVTLTADSLTLILPDYDSGATATDAQRDALLSAADATQLDGRGMNNINIGNLSYLLPDRKDLSRIEIRTGGTVDFQAGSTTIATGGQIAVTALERVFAGEGALLDVAGSLGVALSMESNSLLVNVQPYELRDSPLNRESETLKNNDVWVDVRDLVLVPDGTGGYEGDRYYTANGLLEVGGHLGNVARGIGEWTAQGGTITLWSDEIVVQKDATFDLSGGTLDYAAGATSVTRFLGSDGKLYDIGDAPANVAFLALGNGHIEKSEKWGVTKVYTNPLTNQANVTRQEEGYTVGRDAGTLTLRAPTVVFEGEIAADVVTGGRQTHARPDVSATLETGAPARVDGYKLPQNVTPLAGQLYVGTGNFGNLLPDTYDAPYATDTIIGQGTDIASGLDATTALSGDLANRIELSAGDLNRFGLGELRVLSTGSVLVENDLTLADGGTVWVRGADIEVNADITAHSGFIGLYGRGSGDADVTSITLGEGAALDVTGLWVNLPAGGDPAGLAHLDGGDIYLYSYSGGVVLSEGSLIDASAGAAVLIDGSVVGADGGDVTIVSNKFGGDSHSVVLDGAIRSYGSQDGVGGTLALTMGDTVEIGGSMLAEQGWLGADEEAPYTLDVLEDAVIPAGTVLTMDVTISKTHLLPGEILTENTNVQTEYNFDEVVLSAPVEVPAGIIYIFDWNFAMYLPGDIIPAGTSIYWVEGTLQAGTPIPGGLLPSGIALAAPVLTTYHAGDILPMDYVAAAAGSQIQYGQVVGVPVKVRESTVISQDFFQQGFSQYDIRSYGDIIVADGATVEVQAPVRRVVRDGTLDSFATASGAPVADALQLWTPDLFLEDKANGRFIQRQGASLSLTADSVNPLGGTSQTSLGSIFIGEGATLRVDDGQSITLDARDSLLVQGSLIAHGGAIGLSTRGAPPVGSTTAIIWDATKVLWIDDGAVLDVSGRPATEAMGLSEARDALGRRYDRVSAGGDITLNASNSYVVTRPDALIDISGAASRIDHAQGAAPGSTGGLDLATGGGSLSLRSNRGLVLDARLNAAAGGEGALGGLLSMEIDAFQYVGSINGYRALPPIPDYVRVLANITLDATHVEADLAGIAFGDAIAGNWTPGQTLAEAEAANAGLPDLVLQARIGADRIKEAGFGSLSLTTDDVIVLEGGLDLTLAGTLSLTAGAIGSTDADVDTILRAGYVKLAGKSGLTSIRFAPVGEASRGQQGLDRLPAYGTGILTIEGGLIDAGWAQFGANGAIVRNDSRTEEFEYAAWKTVHLSSAGDFRLTGGNVRTAGDLTVTAAQVYPLTGVTGGLLAGHLDYQVQGETSLSSALLQGSVLTINGLDGVTPAAPLSLYGRVTLSGDVINQNGIVRAPLGRIVFGVGDSAAGTLPVAGGTPDRWVWLDTNTEGGVVGEEVDGWAIDLWLEDPVNGWNLCLSEPWQCAFVAGTPAPSAPPLRQEVNLLDGSLTSVSAAGLIIPWGGTSDDLSWDYNGTEIAATLASQGVAIIGSLRADAGSVLDLSGGGTVAGAGFVVGRGGSVDVLTHPLAEVSPAYRGLSTAGNTVYALVPSQTTAAAPSAQSAYAQPAAGRQIVIPAGVEGLPAGTYTLMSAEYALLPGAFRVELGAAVNPGTQAVTKLADGSFVVAATSVNALTGERTSLPLQAILTPANVVRTYAEYNESDLSAFFRNLPDTTLFENVLPLLPEDGKQLILGLTAQADAARALLSFDGATLFAAGEGGRGGSLAVLNASAATHGVEVVADGATASEGFIAVEASELNAIGAGLITVGGAYAAASASSPHVLNFTAGGGLLPRYAAGSATVTTYSLNGFSSVVVRDGAVLSAPQIMLIADSDNEVVVESGATLTSIGRGNPVFDAGSGYILQTNSNILAVSNGLLEISGGTASASGGITVEDGARLHSDGTLAFVTNGAVSLGDQADYGARYVNLASGAFNIGDAQALADAQAGGVLPSGITLNQSVLERLLAGSTAANVPAAERLILTANQSLNLYGTLALDAGTTGEDALQLVINSPAIYGSGGDGDTATIRAGTLVWNGVVGARPGGVIAGGAGTGEGTLNLEAGTIVIGYQDGVAVDYEASLDRVAVGFSTVNLTASDRIVSNNEGTLSVWQSQASYGEAGTGGALNLIAPLLTGAEGSVIAYAAGGAIRVATPQGAASHAGKVEVLGAEIRLAGESIAIDTTVALASGKLGLTAQNDVTLGDNARIDLAGQEVDFYGEKRYGWGGDLVVESATGDVTLAEGAVVDLGARYNHAGTVKVTAVNGEVTLDGAINGHALGQDDAPDPELRNGSLDVRAGVLGDFAALNRRLTETGVTEARSFVVKTGDLTIGDELTARHVTVSADGGSLTVDGRIDASGAKPGSIRLSARDDLTLTGNADLDASADRLWVDSHGEPVEAKNRAQVELTALNGTLTLQKDATLDLSSADDVARGKVELNAPRIGDNDVAIAAADSLTLAGVDSVSVNAFRAYEPADGVIDQTLLDGIHLDSDAFIDAAIANQALLGRLAGLRAYADAFHLRPGVELKSAPGESLSISGDLNLAGYRYESLNAATPRTGVHGSGEAGVLLIRAADDLNIYGSITDGFGQPVRTPDDNGWVLYEGAQDSASGTWPADYQVPAAVRLGVNSALPAGAVLGYNISVNAFSVAANTRIGSEVATGAAYTLDRQWVATADIRLPGGGLIARGTILEAGTVLPEGTRLTAGTVLPTTVQIAAMTWPAGVELPARLTLSSAAQLLAGDVIPRNSSVVLDRAGPNGLISADQYPDGYLVTESFTMASGSRILAKDTLPFAITVGGSSSNYYALDTEIDFAFAARGAVTFSGKTITAPIWASKTAYDAGEDPLYQAGEVVNVSLPAGTWFGRGSVIPKSGNTYGNYLAQITIPAGSRLEGLSDSPQGDPGSGTNYMGPYAIRVTLMASSVVPVGATLPQGTTVVQAGGAAMRPVQADGTQGSIWAVAQMLPQGSQSWSMRLVSGADIDSADGRTLRAATDLANSGDSGDSGDLILSDRHHVYSETAGLSMDDANALQRMQNFSVIRTGIGSLDLLAGGSYEQLSLYGIYTAGTPSETIGGTTADGYNVFNQPRATVNSSSNPYLGSATYAGYTAAIEAYQAWYPESGGDLLLSAQGDIRAYATSRKTLETPRVGSGSIGNWLWRQGAYSGLDEIVPTAWWINFGTYVANGTLGNSFASLPLLEGFMGIGTLGGGNLTVIAGGDAGITDNWATSVSSSGLNLAVGGTGRVVSVTTTEGRVTGGNLVQTGGGDLTVRIGGSLNAASRVDGDLNGAFVNLRGDIEVNAGAIGSILPAASSWNGQPTTEQRIDPRRDNPLDPLSAEMHGGIIVAPGDGRVSLSTRGDLVLTSAADPGRVLSSTGGSSYTTLVEIPAPPIVTLYWSEYAEDDLGSYFSGIKAGDVITSESIQPMIDEGWLSSWDEFLQDWISWGYADKVEEPGGDPTYEYQRLAGSIARTGFTLWQDTTSISLFSAGGDLTPLKPVSDLGVGGVTRREERNTFMQDGGRYWYPGTLSVVAASGDVYLDALYSEGYNNSPSDPQRGLGQPILELAPSKTGSLEFLAMGSLKGGGYKGTSLFPTAAGMAIAISGMAWNENDIPNPLRPTTSLTGGNVSSLLTYQRDSAAGTLYEGPRLAARFYAVEGDINNLSLGFIGWDDATNQPYYVGAGAAEIRAGRDIVNFGSSPLFGPRTGDWSSVFTHLGAAQVRGLVVHNDPTDITLLSAGRDIVYTSLNVAGPGNLVIEAGRDIYQADSGIFRSIGLLYGLSPETRDGGAGITVLTGVGAGGPDYQGFLDFYLDPAKLADPARALAEQNVVTGDGLVEKVETVVHTYDGELTLADWLRVEHGYTGDEAGAEAWLTQLQADLAADPAQAQRDLRRDYEQQAGLHLVNWLKSRYADYDGTTDARAYFATLSPDAQAIFARQLYFA